MKEKWLYLVVHKLWFTRIADKVKTSEYREYKPYWIKRLEGKKFTHVFIQNGRRKGSPYLLVEIKNIKVVDFDDLPFMESMFFVMDSKIDSDSFKIKSTKFYQIELGEIVVDER
jgi:hypothetical protein